MTANRAISDPTKRGEETNLVTPVRHSALSALIWHPQGSMFSTDQCVCVGGGHSGPLSLNPPPNYNSCPVTSQRRLNSPKDAEQREGEEWTAVLHQSLAPSALEEDRTMSTMSGARTSLICSLAALCQARRHESRLCLLRVLGGGLGARPRSPLPPAWATGPPSSFARTSPTAPGKTGLRADLGPI